MTNTEDMKTENQKIKRMEEVMLNAHPSVNTMHYDSWILRFAGGYTNRANSVNVLEPSCLPLEEKITHCEEIYAAQGQPAVFKISPLCVELDKLLGDRGYQFVTRTHILTKTLDGLEHPDRYTQTSDRMTEHASDEITVTVEERITPDWQKNCYELNHMNEKMIIYAKQIQERILNTTLCATITLAGKAVACGLCVVEEDYAGLYDIVVSDEHRHRGYGRILCTSLLNQAFLHGATKAYLQVIEENPIAQALYAKLGYRQLYDYWYRVKA